MKNRAVILLTITVKVDPATSPLKGILTPWGYRSLVPKADSTNITLVSSPGEKAFRVMPSVKLSLPLGKGCEDSSVQGEMREYVTTPIIVPAVQVEGMGAALVHLSYLTGNNYRIPALADGERFPDRLYAEFLNVDSSSPTRIARFLVQYGVSLHFERKEDSLTDVFVSMQARLRQMLEMARGQNLDFKTLEQFASFHEVSLIDAESISHLASANRYPDFAWQLRQWSQKGQGEKQSLVPVTRFHSWEDYLRWEILNDISKARLPKACKSCGALVLTPKAKRGRPTEYCERCQESKGKERVRRYRERRLSS